jgi:hypothetical protein
MRKLKAVGTFNNHKIKSSIPLTPQNMKRLEALIKAASLRKFKNGSASKRMNCSSNWLMLRYGIATRVLIHISSEPKQVWIIHRRELDKACKAIKLRNLG